MRQKEPYQKDRAEKVAKDIRRVTRQRYFAEEKIKSSTE
jgi:hypothetical protein